MFPHLQADSCAGIEKCLVTSVLNWDHLALDHMDTPRPHWLLPGDKSLCQPVGVGKSGLKTEEKSQFSPNWAGWCHRSNVSSWQLQGPNPTKAIFQKGSGEIQFHCSCSYRVEFGEEGIQWGHFHFPDISEASHWTEREIFLPPSLSSEFKAIAWAWWVLIR